MSLENKINLLNEHLGVLTATIRELIEKGLPGASLKPGNAVEAPATVAPQTTVPGTVTKSMVQDAMIQLSQAGKGHLAEFMKARNYQHISGVPEMQYQAVYEALLEKVKEVKESKEAV